MQQYRVTVNGAISKILDSCPSEQWSKAAEYIEDRGGICTLERRLVTDLDIKESLTTLAGWLFLKDKAISPWEIFAQVEA